MKKNFGIVLAIALGLSALLLTIAFQAGWVTANPSRQETREGAPTIVSYQGQIWDGDTPYDGTGYFKFAIMVGETKQWSNDGYLPPETSVALTVNDGLFNVNLGDTSLSGMDSPLTALAFTSTNTNLRVWFSPNNSTWTLLPDQRVASVPYALQASVAMSADFANYANSAGNATNAASASNADRLDTLHAADFQLRVIGSCPVGQAVRSIDEFGEVTCEEIPVEPQFITSDLEASDLPHQDMDMVIGADGFALISYWDLNGEDLKVMHCNNRECTSADIYPLDTVGNVGAYTSIAIGNDGRGLISYQDYQNANLKVAHCVDTACSSADIATLDSTNLTGFGTSLVIDSEGYGLISYTDGTTAKLKVAHCVDTACSSATTVIVDPTTIAEVGTGIAIGDDKAALIAYYDYSTANLMVAHCNDADCATSTRTTVTTYSVFSGLSPIIVIGNDGLALIAINRYIDEQVQIFHCQNAACTSGGTFVRSPAGVIDFSFVLGMNGHGLLIHSNTGTLFASTCDNVFCSTFSTFAAGDSGLALEHYNAVAIGTDGLPLIAFNYSNNNHLYVVHCSNELCIPTNGDYLP